MKHPKLSFLLKVLCLLACKISRSASRMSASSNNCTCKTSRGTYSLMPLRNTDNKPRFDKKTPGGWTYTYNPCTPYTLQSKIGICKDVALCWYDTTGDPRDYREIGIQKDVTCEVTDTQIALAYHINNIHVPTKMSYVYLLCNNDSQADPLFEILNKDNFTFTLTSYCGCPNGCLSPIPTLMTTSTSSTEPSPRSNKGQGLDWTLSILLPVLAGVFFLVMLIICLYWLLVSGRIPIYTCCHCCAPRPGTRTLIAGQYDYGAVDPGAVEHDCNDSEQRLITPVQEEDEVVKEKM